MLVLQLLNTLQALCLRLPTPRTMRGDISRTPSAFRVGASARCSLVQALDVGSTQLHLLLPSPGTRLLHDAHLVEVDPLRPLVAGEPLEDGQLIPRRLLWRPARYSESRLRHENLGCTRTESSL